MNTIILTGSPKKNVEKSGSHMLAKAFAKKVNHPCEIYSIALESKEFLLKKVEEADHIIVIVPNYIHSIPSIALDFLYELPCGRDKKYLGFIIQSGYPESSESEIIARYLEKFTGELGYRNMGCVIKGDCAALAIMPDKCSKLLDAFTELGFRYSETGKFDKELMVKFGNPYRVPKSQERLANFLSPVLGYLGWGRMLKANNAYAQRFDMPYLE